MYQVIYFGKYGRGVTGDGGVFIIERMEEIFTLY